MQYKKSATDVDWLPEVNPIRMWKEDANGNLKLPLGELFPVQPNPIWGCTLPPSTSTSDNSEKDTAKLEAAKERKSHILKGLQKYINFWRIGISHNETYAKDMHSYVQYWEDILEELHQPTPRAPPSLLEGFWPNIDWTTSAPPLNGDRGKFHPMDIDVTFEDVIPKPYCGPKNKQPGYTYNPWCDVLVGDFVLVCPNDPLLFPIWMGRALTTTVQTKTIPTMVIVCCNGGGPIEVANIV